MIVLPEEPLAMAGGQVLYDSSQERDAVQMGQRSE